MQHIAIIDLNFPRKPGQKPEFLGTELGKELEMITGRYMTPFVYYSSGKHHDTDTGIVYLDDFCVENNHGTTVLPKTNPDGWKSAHEMLVGSVELLKAIVAAKDRFYKVLGRKR